MAESSTPRRLVVGISGASGIAYGIWGRDDGTGTASLDNGALGVVLATGTTGAAGLYETGAGSAARTSAAGPNTAQAMRAILLPESGSGL